MSAGNTLTSFMPTLFKGLNMVDNEPTDLINAVNINASLAQAALNQVVTYPIAIDSSSYVITPGLLPPDRAGDTPGAGTLTMSNAFATNFKYTEEDRHQLELGGIYSDYYADQVAKSIRQLRNQVEASISGLYTYACRADGSAGVTPFATANNMTDFASVQLTMDENGTPMFDRHLIVSPKAAYNIRGNMSNLYKVNEAGSSDLLRTGSLGEIEGLNCGISAQIKATSAYGTSGVSGDQTTAVNLAGSTTITVTGGAGTIVAGDLVQFSNDTAHTYVCVSDLSASTFKINAPGLVKATASNTLVTVVQSTYTPNMAFSRDAITLVARMPTLNTPGGVLLDSKIIKDPHSKLSYQMALWGGYRQQVIEFGLVWGVAATNPQNLVLLLG
jgi:hypothetical protein